MSTTDDAETPVASVALQASIASVATKSILHPIDTLKSRLQAHPFTTLLDFKKQWRGSWTIKDWYRGLPPKLVLYAPYQAVYMTAYTETKVYLEHMNGGPSAPCTVAAAVSAEILSSFVRVPMEAIKLRTQASTVSTTIGITKEMLSSGFHKTARLFVPQTLGHDIPYSVIQWLIYEHLSLLQKRYVYEQQIIHGEKAMPLWMSALGFFAAGSCSGLLSAFITTPLDIVKTRVIVKERGDKSPIAVASKMLREEGWKVFYRGASVRMVWIGSNMGLYFYSLELVKALLSGRSLW